MDKLSMSVNGNFIIGTVNSDANAALYDVQINHAQRKETKVANLWEFHISNNLVSKSEASSKNAWTFLQKMAIVLKIVKLVWLYQNMTEIVELMKTDEIINNHGIGLKGLKNAYQSVLSEPPKEGR